MTPVVRIGYYAVPDPDDPSQMTYWRSARGGDLVPHPDKARYGPTLWKSPGPGHIHVVPAELHGQARRNWVHHWYATVRAEWLQHVKAAIDADPDGCAARFAAFTTRCCCCGRRLTDPTSKTYGIGPGGPLAGAWP